MANPRATMVDVGLGLRLNPLQPVEFETGSKGSVRLGFHMIVDY